MRSMLLFSAGVIFMLGIVVAFPTPDFTRVSQEHTSLLIQAHHMCYTDILARHCIRDSVPIPLDSIDRVYLETCGHYIDSIQKG
jgi:hypothetical protein